MKSTLIEIGCDGGSLTIESKCITGVFFYSFSNFEIFIESRSRTSTFINLGDAWSFLKQSYPNWYQLYLVQISTQMTDLVKKDYILADDKNEYTINSWLEQLTGRGIGF
jgi:hypothetical protein